MQKHDEAATDPRVGAGESRSLLERLSIGGIEEREAAARIATLEAQLASVQRQHEQFARDIAVKLGIEYAPPVAKGDCAYLAAIESLKEGQGEK